MLPDPSHHPKPLCGPAFPVAGLVGAIAALWWSVPVSMQAATVSHAQANELFENKIRPVLVEKCFDCHSGNAKSLKANLLLDSREGFLRGGDSGAAIVPGDPSKSLLIKALHSTDPDTAMPPKKAGGRLPDPVLAQFEQWIAAGAPWPGGGAAASSQQFDLAKRKSEHWCWKNPVAHPLPNTQNAGRVRGTADAFVFSKLDATGLRPAPPADRSVLLRRLYFDLIGLPPTREQAETFLKDQRPDAIERVVDGLLASPHFGERWARHWMDLVRYGESRGHEMDFPAPNVWQYRDYLIRAFNADVPYNQFVLEHLAGDLIPQRLNPLNKACESVLGTGFWFLGEEVHSPVDPRQDELDRVDNQIDVMSKTFLGVTVACARCHDHKFDAISQRDYYALSGFLISSNRRQVRFETLEHEAALARDLEAWRKKARPLLLKATAEAMRPAVRELQQTLGALVQNSAARDAQSTGNERTAAWKKALTESKTAAEDPLHPVADMLLPAANAPADHFRSALGRVLRSPPARTPDLTEWRVLADFRGAKPAHWIQDGSAFGSGPSTAGEPTLGPSPDRPLARLLTLTAAQRNPAFTGLISKGAPNPGALKTVDASGQMLRSPEFLLESGHLLYLIRGGAKIFAPVQSHNIVSGPLLGKTVLAAKSSPQWQWVRHDLSAYTGLRTHVEISPDGEQDLEVALLLEFKSPEPKSDTGAGAKNAGPAPLPQTPALPFETGALARALYSAAPLETPADLIALLSREFEKALDAMARDRFTDTATTELANWMLQHWELFAPTAHAERAKLAASTQPHWEAWHTMRNSLRKESAVAMAMMDGSGFDELQLKRGSPKLPLQKVARRGLEAVTGPEPLDCGPGSGRLKFAGQIVSASNPLTARVIVNRVWHHLFGRGIVPSVDNLGVLGQLPSHPELLDTLAVEFIQKHRWSLKSLMRSLVLSSVYQMSSLPADPLAEEKDPENVLLHRMNFRRLESEAIRDAVLTVSGRLDPKLGGPSIPVYLSPFMEGRGRPKSGPLDGEGRRSIYISVVRNFLSPMMLAFDAPIPFSTMGKRNISNVPSQALILMNDPFVVECAKKWAQGLDPKATPEERLRSMYWSAFSREPQRDELKDALLFVQEHAAQLKTPAANDSLVWADLAHVLMTTKEFIHLQ